MITIVNIHKHPYDLPEDVYIGRGSSLGNPYTSIKGRKTKADFQCDNRDESVESFEKYIKDKIRDKDPSVCKELNRIYNMAKKGNVNLICFCAPKRCHGDVIKEIIEEVMEEKNKYKQ